MKNILITGGTGFIGSNLAAVLVGRGYSVSVLHRPSSDTSRIKDLNVRHCLGDILDPQGLHAHVHGHDTVFHAAATISFWKPLHASMFECNVNGTRAVVDACCAEGVERLVHVSRRRGWRAAAGREPGDRRPAAAAPSPASVLSRAIRG